MGGRGRFEVAAAAALFGTSAVATRLVDPGADPMTIAVLRAAAGGLALLLVAAAAGSAPWRFRLRAVPTAIGAGAVVAFQLGYFAAVDRSGASTATMATIGIGPVAAGLLEAMLHRRRPSARWTVGVALAVAGIVCIGGATSSIDATALALCAAAGVCFPVYGECIRCLTSDRPPLAAAATVFGAAALPAGLIAGRGVSDATPSVGSIALVAYLGVVTIAVGYALWARGIRSVPLSSAVAITMLEPIAALVLAAVLLGEDPGPLGLVGAFAVVVGIAVASTRSRNGCDSVAIPSERLSSQFG
jgi:DME family drug/metabolite transporter